MNYEKYLDMITKAKNALNGISYGFASAIIWEAIKREENEDNFDRILEISSKVIESKPYKLPKVDRERLLSTLNKFDEVIKARVALLSADTDKVKSYVFESPRLPEMRGASLILEELNSKASIKDNILKKYKLPEECIIYSSGGSILMFVPESLQEEIKKLIETLYLEKTIAATITVVSQAFTYAQICFGLDIFAENPKGFSELVEFLAYKLKRAKQEKKYVPFLDSVPFARQCDSCNIRPASNKDKDGHICHSCYTKRKGSRKGYLLRYFEKSLDSKIKEFGSNLHPAEDLKDIGNLSDNYIGLIYADGNNVGKNIGELHTCMEYQQFAEDMLEATSDKICQEFANSKFVSKDCKLGAEILCGLGSDDIMAIVPGKLALQLAINICRAFEQKMSSYNLTMSAGVIIAPHNYPVYYLEEVCEQLLKSAKNKARKTINKSVIDFWVITSQDVIVSDLKTYRKQTMERISNEKNPYSDRLVLYERPYTLDELQKLLNWIRKFNKEGFPIGQLYGLRESLEKGRMHSNLYYLYQLSRMSKEHKKLIGDFTKDWNPNDSYMFPWRQIKKSDSYDIYLTPLVDLLEIYDLAEEV